MRRATLCSESREGEQIVGPHAFGVRAQEGRFIRRAQDLNVHIARTVEYDGSV
jgi:hypothetical protein